MHQLFDWTSDYRSPDVNALWEMQTPDEPHVRTSMSGDHVSAYFNSDIVTAHPDKVDEIVRTVLLPELKSRKLAPSWIFTYAPYGLFVAGSCARLLDAKNGYVNPGNDYKTSFGVKAGDEVLVVCDDIYSGGGLKKTIQSLEAMGAKVLPVVFSLANLSGGDKMDGRDIISGAHIPTRRFPSDACELCKQGSEPLTPRDNWELLQSHKIS